jgi:hypothetical protein
LIGEVRYENYLIPFKELIAREIKNIIWTTTTKMKNWDFNSFCISTTTLFVKDISTSSILTKNLSIQSN